MLPGSFRGLVPETNTERNGDVAMSPMPKLTTAARILMGLIFLVMGLNGFLNFLPQPATMPTAATAFLGGLVAAGYMLPLLSGTQVVVAVLLLSDRFVPLALALIAPVIVNIILFHLFLMSAGAPIAAFTALLELYLAWAYRSAYRPMLTMRVDASLA
jgi:uncharacterized membrane protein YphA (DoxX/SURF4 family)